MHYIRTTILTLLGLTALAVMAFGGRSVESHKGQVVVTYWEKWTGKEAEQMQQIVNDFNQSVGQQKGIYVQYLSMSSVDQKTLVATAAGVPPDIAGLWNSQVAQFATINAVEPLDDLAAAHGITASYYKPVYWEGCRFNGHLWALISTPATIALHYNKRLMLERADSLRKAGLDPNRPPRTLDELDRYAQALDMVEKTPNGQKRIKSAGYLPMEPSWMLTYIPYWFGNKLFDEKTQKLTLTDPDIVRAFEWVKSYSVRLGKDSMTEFTNGFGQFASPQNPFLVGNVVMTLQGPWTANYVEDLKPSMNRWKFPKEKEKGMSVEERRKNYEWGAAPFPSAVPGLTDVSYASFDTLMIPRGAKHKQEAFEFIAYVNRQDVMEKLNSLHCKNSPLSQVSEQFIRNHPNPYISVFEELARSKNARGVPPMPIWPEVADELGVVAQRVYLLQAEPKEALQDAQNRLQEKYETFLERQRLRAKS
ncbi:MAG: ABC transporter substrate-binding protein [Abitibacteriaceae bacterium]|nr:ABC transporter substrate-binding protein [Abditibacteriaceae bacterium]